VLNKFALVRAAILTDNFIIVQLYFFNKSRSGVTATATAATAVVLVLVLVLVLDLVQVVWTFPLRAGREPEM
jgi:uncharacterized membrane-anchored protein